MIDPGNFPLVCDALYIFIIHCQKQIGFLKYHTFEPEKNKVAKGMIQKFEEEIKIAEQIIESLGS